MKAHPIVSSAIVRWFCMGVAAVWGRGKKERRTGEGMRSTLILFALFASLLTGFPVAALASQSTIAAKQAWGHLHCYGANARGLFRSGQAVCDAQQQYLNTPTPYAPPTV